MKINVLFAYPIIKGSTAYELYKSFKKNCNVNLFHLFLQELELFSKKTPLIDKILWKLKIPIDRLDINKKLLDYDLRKIDIIFTVKGNAIYPWTLKKLKKIHPGIKILSWSQDDMFAWHNRSIYYTLGIKYYDLVITQKSYNIEELKKLGAKRVLFQNKAYSKDLHKKYYCKKCLFDVVFIGDYEKDRYEKMLYLANNGIKIYIFGPNWKRKVHIIHDNLVISGPIIGKDYAKALSCSKIALCFLRKLNRDLQTSRSIEIPACGGFMIAERTEEHKKLFEENKEAVYFSTREELLAKIKYYLKHEEERKKIAQKGYERTRNSPYSYDDRVEEIIRYIKDKL